MRTVCRILLTFSTALCAASGAFSDGRVVCVGADDHVAVEARHDVCPAGGDSHGSHPDAGGPHDSGDSLPVASASRSCVDYDLPAGGGDRLTGGGGVAGPALVPFLLPAPAWTVAAEPAAPVWSGPPDDDPPDHALTSLRSVVLLT